MTNSDHFRVDWGTFQGATPRCHLCNRMFRLYEEDEDMPEGRCVWYSTNGVYTCRPCMLKNSKKDD